MKVAVVDASVWVSFYLPHDDHHQLSGDWLIAHISEDGIVVGPSLLLAEVASPIARRTGRPELGSRAVQQLMRSRWLRLIPNNRGLAVRAAQLAAQMMLRGADALYVSIAQELACPLVTLDQQQQDRAAKMIDVHYLR